MPQDRGHRRKHSRSLSPLPAKHKRSWQNSSDGGARRPPPPRHRSPSPVRGGKKDFRPPGKFGGCPSSPGSGPFRRSRSRSPRHQKRPRPKSPMSGRGPSPPPYARQPQVPPPVAHERSGSRSNLKHDRPGSRMNQRSMSPPRPPPKTGGDRDKREGKYTRLSPSPGPGPSMKKKMRHSPSPGPSPKRTRSRSRNRSPLPSSSHKRIDPPPPPGHSRGDSIPQRKVSTAGKKKPPRITLHKRFTLEDQMPFELEENVTIAILRNPNVEPSEDVTVKRVFDASVFKMVHKKTEGRKPIFDREEIKVWRHDENLADDPDFERRLVRVKSTSMASKPASDSLSRMSPDVIRKAFGLQVGARSRSRSPHREPQIRLDPRPDPRYESKFRQQLEKEEGLGMKKRRDDEKRRGDEDRKGGGGEKRGSKGDLKERDRRREDEKRGGGRHEVPRGKGDTYDLRQALERRRSDREEGGAFRIEVRRGEGDPGAELFYRDERRSREGSPDRFLNFEDGGGRNVVLDQDRDRRRFGGSMEREDRRSWDNDRRSSRGRGGGRGGRGRGRRREWSRSPERGILDRGMRDDDIRDFRDRERSVERRPRYSNSPPNNRGWRGGGFRGRGRGRGRDFDDFDQEILSPTEIDDSFKYSQHDDRDLSPKPFRGRGGRSRFPSRSFGSSNFRVTSRGGPRGGRRSFRGGYRGRGFGSIGDRRSVDRVRDISLDREWKHDMYDSLQAEEEQPHSTTVGN